MAARKSSSSLDPQRNAKDHTGSGSVSMNSPISMTACQRRSVSPSGARSWEDRLGLLDRCLNSHGINSALARSGSSNRRLSIEVTVLVTWRRQNEHTFNPVHCVLPRSVEPTRRIAARPDRTTDTARVRTSHTPPSQPLR
jgi:hypothetical protein